MRYLETGQPSVHAMSPLKSPNKNIESKPTSTTLYTNWNCLNLPRSFLLMHALIPQSASLATNFLTIWMLITSTSSMRLKTTLQGFSTTIRRILKFELNAGQKRKVEHRWVLWVNRNTVNNNNAEYCLFIIEIFGAVWSATWQRVALCLENFTWRLIWVLQLALQTTQVLTFENCLSIVWWSWSMLDQRFILCLMFTILPLAYTLQQRMVSLWKLFNCLIISCFSYKRATLPVHLTYFSYWLPTSSWCPSNEQWMHSATWSSSPDFLSQRLAFG